MIIQLICRDLKYLQNRICNWKSIPNCICPSIQTKFLVKTCKQYYYYITFSTHRSFTVSLKLLRTSAQSNMSLYYQNVICNRNFPFESLCDYPKSTFQSFIAPMEQEYTRMTCHTLPAPYHPQFVVTDLIKSSFINYNNLSLKQCSWQCQTFKVWFWRDSDRFLKKRY